MTAAKATQTATVEALETAKSKLAQEQTHLAKLEDMKSQLLAEKDRLVQEAKDLAAELDSYTNAEENLATAKANAEKAQTALELAQAQLVKVTNDYNQAIKDLDEAKAKQAELKAQYDQIVDFEANNVITVLPDGTVVAVPKDAPTEPEKPEYKFEANINITASDMKGNKLQNTTSTVKIGDVIHIDQTKEYNGQKYNLVGYTYIDSDGNILQTSVAGLDVTITTNGMLSLTYELVEEQPSNPSEPSNPSQPVDPEQPIQPTKPTKPVTPTNPSEPTTPSKPDTGNTGNTGNGSTTEPNNGGSTIAPNTPSNPVKPSTGSTNQTGKGSASSSNVSEVKTNGTTVKPSSTVTKPQAGVTVTQTAAGQKVTYSRVERSRALPETGEKDGSVLAFVGGVIATIGLAGTRRKRTH